MRELILDIIHSYKHPLRQIIVNIRWAYLWRTPPDLIETFAEALIDAGAVVVYGSGSPNLSIAPSRIYNNGLIIYCLGELANYIPLEFQRYENFTEVCTFNTISKRTRIAFVSKRNVHGCYVPRAVESIADFQ